MRAERLRVENLGPIEAADLELRPVTMLMGPNESGKSFLLTALGLLRFGTLRGLKQNEAAALARSGSRGWAVEASLCVNPDAESVLLRRTRTSGPDGATLDGAMGDARVWRALLDGRSFFELTPAERRALVADLFAKDTAGVAREVHELGARPEIVGAVTDGDMRRAHRLATEDRRAVKRVMEQVEIALAQPIEDPEVDTKAGRRRISTLDREIIAANVAKVRARLDAATAANARASALASSWAAAESAREKLAALTPPPAWDSASEVKWAECQDAVARLTSHHAQLAAGSRSARQELERQAAAMKAAEAGTCPTCEQPLPRAHLAEIAKQFEAAKEAASEAGRALAQAASDKEAADKRLDEIGKAREAWRAYETARARLQATIDAGRESAPQATEDVGTLQQEVRRIEAYLWARDRYDAKIEEQAKGRERMAGLNADLQRAEAIERLCTPDRIDDEADKLARINERCAAYAPKLLGVEVRLAADWTIQYGAHRIELASDSAAIRVGAVFSLALGVLSRVRCVFIDRLEALDDTQRKRCLALLGELAEAGEIETAIVATVRETKPPPATVPAWLGRVWVDRGAVSYIDGGATT